MNAEQKDALINKLIRNAMGEWFQYLSGGWEGYVASEEYREGHKRYSKLSDELLMTLLLASNKQ